MADERTERMQEGFLFVDLADPGALTAGMEIDLRPRKFTDMWGYEFEIKKADLAKIVANTRAAIRATKDSSGSPVGLPIDALDHRSGDAAGWITDARLEGSMIKAYRNGQTLG